MKKTKRLGRGLDALIPDKSIAENNNNSDDSNLFEIEVASVKANPYQPRQEFDPVALDELKTSIKENGIIQPITVRRVDKHYELIAGERRLRAVVELGFKKVPAYIIKVDTKEEMLELAIIENVQRERLNPIEQAQAFQRLVDECNLTQDEVAQKIGKDRTTITNFLRLLKLPNEIQDSVRKHELTMGHARTLLAIDDSEVQRQVWKKVIKNSLSVRRLEKLIKDLAEVAKQKQAVKPRRSVFLQKAEEDLRELFGTKVNIRSRKEGGTIEVEFYSPEDLNRLLEILQEIQKS
ncbi:MAG: ParB/RepB/Spo0J family partition protein [Calditrichaceae bacterium]|nr:ParB/RepB/Spo0J family partition protein [Calditrichaceae bacterium]HES60023.1 ParB/RepB/Spo0J family partition protein [Caldithrix sp.]